MRITAQPSHFTQIFTYIGYVPNGSNNVESLFNHQLGH